MSISGTLMLITGSPDVSLSGSTSPLVGETEGRFLWIWWSAKMQIV